MRIRANSRASTPLHRGLRKAALTTIFGAGLSLACALGFRGATEVDAVYSLDEIDAVRISLPDTPMSVLGDPVGVSLEVEGVWYSVGGSSRAAADHSTAPSLFFAREGRFGELSAVIPTASRDLVDLELGEVRIPSDRDLELRTGLGDVDISQVEGNLSVDVDAGRVTIFGGADGIGVRTGVGDIEIETTGNTTASTGRGDVVISQLGAGGNDLIISTSYGSIDAVLRSDSNLDLNLEASGDIRVQTRTVSTVTTGSFVRTIGNGSVTVELRALGGDINVRLDESL